jgi:RNA:NAD 2'-phosphotransferase (TPT1/KptA family)
MMAEIKNMIQELRDMRELAELLSYIVDHVKMDDDGWKYVDANLGIMRKRVNGLVNELTDLVMTIDRARSLIEHGNYNDAKASLIAIADSLSAITGDLSG